MKALFSPAAVLFGVVGALAVLVGGIAGFVAVVEISRAGGRSMIISVFGPAIGAGLGAAISVAGAIYVASWRLGKEEKRAVEDRRRRLDGARAIFANDLSYLIEYTMSCSQAISHLIRVVEKGPMFGEITLRNSVECPEFNNEILLRLQNLVELIDDPGNAQQIVDLMNNIQVQRARLVGEIDRFNRGSPGMPRVFQGQHSFVAPVQSTVELYVRAERAFHYARHETEVITAPPFTKKEVNAAYFFLPIKDLLNDFEQVHLMKDLRNMPPENRSPSQNR